MKNPPTLIDFFFFFLHCKIVFFDTVYYFILILLDFHLTSLLITSISVRSHSRPVSLNRFDRTRSWLALDDITLRFLPSLGRCRSPSAARSSIGSGARQSEVILKRSRYKLQLHRWRESKAGREGNAAGVQRRDRLSGSGWSISSGRNKHHSHVSLKNMLSV